jgi:hypothetical protein
MGVCSGKVQHFNVNDSPASQVHQNIGMKRKKNYRRYRLFYSANIGDFKDFK